MTIMYFNVYLRETKIKIYKIKKIKNLKLKKKFRQLGGKCWVATLCLMCTEEKVFHLLWQAYILNIPKQFIFLITFLKGTFHSRAPGFLWELSSQKCFLYEPAHLMFTVLNKLRNDGSFNFLGANSQ